MIKNANPDRLQRGAIMLAVGAIMLGVGVYLLAEVITPQSNKWLINFSPLVAFAGIVLIGQGGIMLALKGRKLTAWFLAFPTFIFILVVVLVPTIYVIGVSFIRWDIQVPGREFIFLDNYETLINTDRVRSAVLTTGIIAFAAVALEFVLGIGLALLFVDRFFGRAVALSVIIIPMMMAPIVVGQTARMLWNTRFGAVNHLLSVVTGSTVELQWFGQKELAFVAIIITDVWQWTPFIFLIALAGLLAINTELYEAAAIDGASAWQIFWRITLPILRPILLVALLFRLIEALKMFDIIFVTTNGGPGRATENITLYLFEQGFQFARFGFSAAGAVLFLLAIIIISTLLVRIIGER